MAGDPLPKPPAPRAPCSLLLTTLPGFTFTSEVQQCINKFSRLIQSWGGSGNNAGESSFTKCGAREGRTKATPNSTTQESGGVCSSVCSCLFLCCQRRSRGSGEGASVTVEQGVWEVLVLRPSLVVVRWEGAGGRALTASGFGPVSGSLSQITLHLGPSSAPSAAGSLAVHQQLSKCCPGVKRKPSISQDNQKNPANFLRRRGPGKGASPTPGTTVPVPSTTS